MNTRPVQGRVFPPLNAHRFDNRPASPHPLKERLMILFTYRQILPLRFE
jgi:hypothetical protein